MRGPYDSWQKASHHAAATCVECHLPVVYLVTADRRPQWVRNVLARPGVELRTGGETFHGEREPVTRSEETARVIELLTRKYWLARPYLWLKGAPDGVLPTARPRPSVACSRPPDGRDGVGPRPQLTAMRAGVQGGSNVRDTSTCSTPGIPSTARRTQSVITSWSGQPAAVSVIVMRTVRPSIPTP